MELLSGDFKVTIDEKTGSPTSIISLKDEYKMNWIRSDYEWGKVNGFKTENIEKTNSGISVSGFNSDRKLKFTVNRFIKNGKYFEEYTFNNICHII